MALTRVSSAEYVAYDLDGTFTCNKPTGTTTGDLMVAFVMTYDGDPTSVPSGWTQLMVNDVGTLMRTYVYTKFATSGDSGTASYSWGLDPGFDLAGGIVIHTFRGARLTTPISDTVQAQSTTLETLASGNVTVANTGSWLLGMSSCRHTGTTDCTASTASMTDRHDACANDTAASFSRALCTFDSNGTVAAGTYSRTSVRTGTTAAHSVILLVVEPEPNTAKSGSDTASGVDAGSVRATFTQTDTGTGTDAVTNIRVTPTGDSASGVDAHSLAVSFTGTDTGSGVDSGAISASLSGAETASGTESHSLTASLSQGDTGSSVDDGNAAGDPTPESDDSGSFTETFVTFATLSGADSFTAFENQAISVPPVPYELGEFDKTLVMGPANLYIAAYGALEPEHGLVGSIPDPSVWTPLGGTLGGVELVVEQEFKTVIFEQMPDTTFNRLQKRYLTIKTPLAETTLSNLALALNDSAGVTGTAYTPSSTDSATPLVYRALIVDGWAPGMTAFDRHKRRRIIVRKCLSVDNLTFDFTKTGQTVYNVTWSCHHVDGSTAPFRVIDEA